MMGIDPALSRTRMAESLDVILRLLRGEVVTAKSDWFDLHDAQLWSGSFTQPHMEMAVAQSRRLVHASQASTASAFCRSPRASRPATTPWTRTGSSANGRENTGQSVRESPRLPAAGSRRSTSPRTYREQAELVVDGVYQFVKCSRTIRRSATSNGPSLRRQHCILARERLHRFGMGIIGTPDDAIERIEDFVRKSGGFGTFLLWCNSKTADWEAGNAAELRPLRPLRGAPLPWREALCCT